MKRFNKEGNKKFISLMKSDFLINSSNPPDDFKRKYKSKFQDLIKDEKNLENLEQSGELNYKKFENRFEFGKYIASVLKNCSFSKINRDEGLWNYISCFFLEDFIS